MQLDVPNFPHIHCQVDFNIKKIPFLEFTVSHMTMSYTLQAAEMNKKSPRELSLNLTLTQHHRDEDHEPWEVCFCFEIEPSQVWYYQFFSNFRTLVIVLQVDSAFNNELEIVYGNFYEIENISIFAWFSILDIWHYHWLCYLICQLPFKNKVDYLIHTIRCILNFLQLWSTTMP